MLDQWIRRVYARIAAEFVPYIRLEKFFVLFLFICFSISGVAGGELFGYGTPSAEVFKFGGKIVALGLFAIQGIRIDKRVSKKSQLTPDP